MLYTTDWLAELQSTSADLLQDAVLLEALALYTEQRDTRLNPIPPEILGQTRGRLLDYLSQHATDLYFLSQRMEPL